MEEAVMKEEKEKEFGEKREEMKKKDEMKTGKNRRRREKAKLRKGGKGEVAAGPGQIPGAGTAGDDTIEKGQDGHMEGVGNAISTENTGIFIHDDD